MSTRVLVIDDSALVRQVLSEVLSSSHDLEVAGTAPDPYKAWQKIQELDPDVVTLDVEMPRMDGLQFLEQLMRRHPMPVVMVSSLTEQGCETTLRALELGAVDFITKPKLDVRNGTVALAEHIVEKVRAAASARVGQHAGRRPEARPRSDRQALHALRRHPVCIGASTGGTEALRAILTELPADAPPVLVVQHMPEGFTRAFAQRLDGLCAVSVMEARDGDEVLPGRVLVAPGGRQMEIAPTRGSKRVVHVFDGPPVNRHAPSVDVLFESAARELGERAMGVLLTGMGADGARGLLAMREAGAATAAQDETTSVVFGMPKAAIALGAAELVLELDRIAEAIVG